MKLRYILIEHGEADSPALIKIYGTPEKRNKATLEAIFGDKELECEKQAEGLLALNRLENEGWLHFESDPPLQWVTGHTNEIQTEEIGDNE